MARFGGFDPAQSEAYVGRCERCGEIPFGTGTLCQRCRRKRFIKTCAAVFITAELALAGAIMLLPREQPRLQYAAAQPQPPQPRRVAGLTGWIYYDTQDQVIGDVTHHARLISNAPRNDAHDRRLRGVAAGTLELSASKTYGRHVSLSFGKVKTACQANPCQVRVIFDETQPQAFPYTDASDEHGTVLVLGDYDRFAQRLAVSHDLTVVASLGADRDNVLSFTVAGYRMADAGGRMVIELASIQRRGVHG